LNCNILIPVEWPRLLIIYEMFEMFWRHWNLSALGSFYGLPASGSETEYTKTQTVRNITKESKYEFLIQISVHKKTKMSFSY
jgi:hypothetical protein